jgi:hypothetical protein
VKQITIRAIDRAKAMEGSLSLGAVSLSRQQAHNFTQSQCHLEYAILTLALLLI